MSAEGEGPVQKSRAPEVMRLTVEDALQFEQDKLSASEFGVWFWEATDTAVVLGLACKDEEAIQEAAQADNVKIIKRRSGGGTVVLGPGVLCFTVILPGRKEVCNPVGLANEIMPPVAEALTKAGLPCEVRGSGDLAHNGKKICGTAQKWTRKAILFHGSILVDFDTALIEKYLSHPPKEPDYRKGRSHCEFCINLSDISDSSVSIKEVSSILYGILK